jgi:hypothetical protein
MTIKISGFQVGAPSGIPQYGTAPTYFAVTDGYNDGGAGLPSLTWSAPAYSTSIAFVTSDKSDNDPNGYINGWTAQEVAQNSGADWWEYIWASTIENPSTVTNATSTINNNLNGRSVSVIHVLNGIGIVSPVVVGSYHSFGTDYSSISSLSSYNLNNTEFGVLCMGVEGHNYANGNIVSVTSSSGLTWTKKSSKSYYNDAGNGGDAGLFQTCEVWYAKNDTGSDVINDTISIQYTGNFDDQTNVIINFGGVDFTNIWAA